MNFTYSSTEFYTENTNTSLLLLENSPHLETPTLVYIGYVLGILITISNLPVVISSGLILKKGKKPKTTYILLGNVSLADTILGAAIIYGAAYPKKSDDPLCIFLMGILVCPAMVSIFSVGLIAVDRYIYIIHGLYYGRWINTTRVRCGIILIWVVSMTLSFLPGFGWVQEKPSSTKCYYINTFPEELILFNSFISIIPIIVVVVLYSIILVKALKTVESIKQTVKIKNVSPSISSADYPKLRMYRGTVNVKSCQTAKVQVLKRSASFDINLNVNMKLKNKSKSIEDLTNMNETCKKEKKEIKLDMGSNLNIESITSVNTIASHTSEIAEKLKKLKMPMKCRQKKEPNKWRAIIVVMLTLGCFIITWMPLFVTVTVYVFCKEKTSDRCYYYGHLSSTTLSVLGFCNSLLNPLIYAWWHKGFQKSVKIYYRRLFHRSRT